MMLVILGIFVSDWTWGFTYGSSQLNHRIPAEGGRYR